ncbi:Exosome component 10 [Strongyloides ratti]|uniref:Exosome component 10 n=1 Tax=Strongyloides ratti TaxID=34506 RepID=A0A090LIN3_STRRB|nr:Exosome component 10 [Strongyloides ratti]CEF67350.1 Exosome component 10 [Strongyloides ratti]
MDEEPTEFFPYIREPALKYLPENFKIKEDKILDELRNIKSTEDRETFCADYVKFYNSSIDLRKALSKVAGLSSRIELDSVEFYHAKTISTFRELLKAIKSKFTNMFSEICSATFQHKYSLIDIADDDIRMELVNRLLSASKKARYQLNVDEQRIKNKIQCRSNLLDLNVVVGSKNKRTRVDDITLTIAAPNKKIRKIDPAINLLTVSHKPQDDFKDCIINDDAPFISKLKVKHNAKVEWKGYANDDNEIDKHPYIYELRSLEISEDLLKEQAVVPVKSLSDTPLLFVNTTEGLENIIQYLKTQKEFAVDLEHHSLHSFLGITCLIQISTYERDIIIDPFPIWRDMWKLNDPFSDPNILKIFHGAKFDIIWLQRDFGIYVVNMLDTQCVMKVLNITPLGLASLIYCYFSVELDKKYQLADWRYRPLTYEMIQYARSDTHYLLGAKAFIVNHCLRSGNRNHNLIRVAFEESTLLCMNHFEQPRLEIEVYGSFKKRFELFSPLQKLVFRRLYRWRDEMARMEDESLEYIMTENALYSIVECHPIDVQSLLCTCVPTPPYLLKHANEISSMLYKMREYSLDECEKYLEEEEKNFIGSSGRNIVFNTLDINEMRMHAMFDKMDYSSEYNMNKISKTICLDERLANLPSFECSITTGTNLYQDFKKRIYNEGKEAVIKAPFYLKNRLEYVIPKKVENRISEVHKEHQDWITPYEKYCMGIKLLKELKPDSEPSRDVRIAEEKMKSAKSWAEL